MNKFITLSLWLLLATAARGAHAKAAYQTPKVMIANSEAIALVQIDHIEPAQMKGSHWIYGQKATARVERTFKGQLPPSLTLLGDENFICARCHFETGRFLVFLKREKAGWAGVNYQHSARKIEDGQVNWNDARSFADKPVALDAALENITTIIASQKQSPHYSLISWTQDQARVWIITDTEKPDKSRTLKQPELEEWLRTLTAGTEVSLCQQCRGNNATPAEVQTLHSFAHSLGLGFVIVPAG